MGPLPLMKHFYLITFLLITFSGAFSQAPNISYQTPQVYTINAPINSLAPTNTGGAVPATIYGQVTTFAGNGTRGNTNGATLLTSSFNSPTRLAIDKSNNFYITDRDNAQIRKITPAGVITTLATGFNQPNGITCDVNGNIYVTDAASYVIKKITPAGVVSIFAGSGSRGFNNGTGIAASFDYAYAIKADASDNLIVSDTYNNSIRKVNTTSVVTTIAGNGAPGFANGISTAATFDKPDGLDIDGANNIYVADASNYRIRKITPAGVVTTHAGNGIRASINGPAASASFSDVGGVAVDKIGNVYVAEIGANLIRKVDVTGNVTTLAGSGNAGLTDGVGTAAGFKQPNDVQATATGELFVTDYGNNVIRKIILTGYTIDKPLPAGLSFDPTTGIITGTPTAISPATNYTITAYNLSGSSSTIVNISVASTILPPNISYQTPNVYTINTGISPLAPTNTGGSVPATIYGKVTIFAGNGSPGSANGTGTFANFNNPYNAAIDNNKNLFIADYYNNLIRKITTPGAVVTTFAGNGSSGWADGTGTSASFNRPGGVTCDALGNVYVGDQDNNLIRKITPGGVVTTYAGNGSIGSANGPSSSASFSSPAGVVLDKAGDLFVADRNNNVIRKITPAGMVSTFAGSGIIGAINGTGTAARFSNPTGLAIDAADNIYVADQNNNLIRKITPAGEVTTYAGTGVQGTNDGPANAATFTRPFSLCVDISGDLYVGDEFDHLVRRITSAGLVSTLAGTGVAGGTDGVGKNASFNYPAGVIPDGLGNLYVTETIGQRIRKIIVTGYVIDKPLPAGLVFDQTTGIITGTPTVTSPATNYTITAYNMAGSSSAVVNIQVTNVAALTITADNKTRAYGVANPALTVSYSGFANGDDATKLTTQPTVTTTATTSSNVGNYPIIASGAASPNYTITYVAGTLTITPATRTLTFNPIPPKVFTDPDFDPGATIDTNDPIIYTSSDPTIAVIIGGKIHILRPGIVTITATVAPKANYADVPSKTQQLLIDGSEVRIRPVVTPNGDGINDVLMIDGITNYPDNHLTLVNANGIKVFEADAYDNINNVFNGRSNVTNAYQPQGTYFYSLRYKTASGENKKLVGFVVLKYSN